MPADFDMILSASPPLFSQSALADFHYAYNHQSMPTGRNRHLPHRENMLRLNAINESRNRANNGKGTVVTTPIRPILMIKTVTQSPDDEVVVPDLESPTSPSGRDKKKVWFADDKGMALTHVRIMTEPSDCPPRWTDSFLEHVTGRGNGLSTGFALGGVKCRRSYRVGGNGQMKESHWEPTFPQPASDYVAFRHKLEGDNVSLENVIVKEEGQNAPLVTGTVKVKNISFDKEVVVRFTFDRWLSHVDSPCSFVSNGLEQNVTTQYDTFSFSEPIPPTADKYETVEFCVKYACDGSEYWDSNGGTNFRLKLVEKPVPEPDKPALDPVVARYNDVPKFADPVTADFDRWTEFASWNHLINDSPYW